VSTDDVLRVLRPIWQDKQETASRLRGRIEKVLDYAKAIGLRDGENPARWKGHLDHTAKMLMSARCSASRSDNQFMPGQSFTLGRDEAGLLTWPGLTYSIARPVLSVRDAHRGWELHSGWTRPRSFRPDAKGFFPL
jgi:hypothetical protein